MRKVTGAGVVILAAAIAAGVTVTGCKRTNKIDALRDALAQDDESALKSAFDGLPACTDMPPAVLSAGEPSPRDRGCFSEIANAFGSQKGFVVSPPDQAAAATTALVVGRDHRGDWIAHSSVWLAAMKIGTGAGIDALRLAIANAMAAGVPLVSRKNESDADARATMKMVASSIPGACPTYWALGTGADLATLTPPLSADHSACVHENLAGPFGAGARYGAGIPRALEGSLALWRDAASSLRRGLDRAAPPVKAALEKKLAIIEPATASMEQKAPSASAVANANQFLSDLHADAGIMIGDAGEPDASAAHADAAVPKKHP